MLAALCPLLSEDSLLLGLFCDHHFLTLLLGTGSCSWVSEVHGINSCFFFIRDLSVVHSRLAETKCCEQSLQIRTDQDQPHAKGCCYLSRYLTFQQVQRFGDETKNYPWKAAFFESRQGRLRSELRSRRVLTSLCQRSSNCRNCVTMMRAGKERFSTKWNCFTSLSPAPARFLRRTRYFHDLFCDHHFLTLLLGTGSRSWVSEVYGINSCFSLTRGRSVVHILLADAKCYEQSLPQSSLC